MTLQNKRLGGIIAAVVLLLLVPLIAMQFTTEVQWSWFDFLVAAILLFGTGLTCELVLRKVKSAAARIAICVAVLAALVIVWAELAVGILGTTLAGS